MRLDRENDIEQLRKAALLLEREIRSIAGEPANSCPS